MADNERVWFSAPLPDPTGGPEVTVTFQGAVSWQGGTGDPGRDREAVTGAIRTATVSVLSQALRAQQVALPTLAGSMSYFSTGIAQQAGPALAPYGIGLGALSLGAEVPQSAVAPAAAAIAQAPTVMDSVVGNFAGNVASHAASHVPTHLKVNVGGVNLKIGADGVDGSSAIGSIKDKIFDNLLGCAIVGGVVALLGVLTFVVLIKVLVFS